MPEARLVLKDRLIDRASQQEPILAALAEEGAAPERVTILNQENRAAGPEFARAARFSSRLAAANLTAAGLDDYIASNFDHYVELAVAKAGDLGALAELCSTLRDRIANTEFGDPKRYARAVEKRYRVMWQQWCEKQRTAVSSRSERA